MTTNVITAPTATPAATRPPRLQVLTLIVASAAAVIAVFAIATDDVGTAPRVAVEDPVARQPAAPLDASPMVAIDPNIDACGRPILRGRLACR